MDTSIDPVVIHWFRQDLRLGDNPAFAAATATGRPVLSLYVLDDSAAGQWAMGGASRWWLHRSLQSLDRSLDGSLCLQIGDAVRLIPELALQHRAVAVYCNRCVEPWRQQQDESIGKALAAAGVELRCFSGSTLFEPDKVRKQDGTPYRVFTPYYRKGCLQNQPPPREPVAAPQGFESVRSELGVTVEQLDLLPTVRWYQQMEAQWQVGEDGALQRLDEFLDQGINGYREGRNRPDQRKVSRLSPHLHFGEISPNQAWYAVQSLPMAATLENDIDCFMSELGWREFSNYLLHHFPALPTENLQPKFNRFPWQHDAEALERWQRGLTGIPIVDAGMRELWQTGYMHNRVRMIVGSFLVKNLLQDWRAGAEWFWDTLVDADLANNSASWQWVAGSGADAAPYFRIFNPLTQGEKFDPKGDYVRRYVPELAGLDTADIHGPWKLPSMLRDSLGYPEPLVDLKQSRQRALDTFKALSS